MKTSPIPRFHEAGRSYGKSDGVPSAADYFEDVSCNFCGSDRRRVLFHADEKSLRGDVVKCPACALIYRSPRPAASSPVHRRRSRPDAFSAGRQTIFEDYLRMASGCRKLNRILDVGSGDGVFLKACLDLGWKATGLEIDPDLARSARDVSGTDVFAGTIEEAQYQDGYFDAVTMINVVEHMHDPKAALSQAYRVLRPGGVLLMRTSNADFNFASMRLFRTLSVFSSNVKRTDGAVFHNYAFGRRSLLKYLEGAGFRNIRIMNARMRWVEDSHRAALSLVSGALFKAVLEGMRILSMGKLLMAPSLAVIAEKPHKDCHGLPA